MNRALVDPVPIVAGRIDARLSHLLNQRRDRVLGKGRHGAVRVVGNVLSQDLAEFVLGALTCSTHYPGDTVVVLDLLVEAREWLDEYDRNTPGLAEGIPTEGLAIYDVDESTWPPLWLKAQGLKDGAEYVNDDQRFKVKVGRHVAGGGFQVSVVPLPESQRCAEIRNEIAAAKSEITTLQSELHEPGANKPEIIRQIRELQRAIATLTGEGNALHCTL